MRSLPRIPAHSLFQREDISIPGQSATLNYQVQEFWPDVVEAPLMGVAPPEHDRTEPRSELSADTGSHAETLISGEPAQGRCDIDVDAVLVARNP